MAEDLMRYDLLTQEALRGVVRQALQRVRASGLPGEHHFYISFDTRHAGVVLSERLRARHSDNMTIVLQHQFWNLAVDTHAFEVELSFNDVAERLVIPFAAIKSFFDPHAKFGLQFEMAAPLSEGTPEPDPVPAERAPVAKKAPPEKEPQPVDAAESSSETGEKVVVLDQFRKK
jgi:hypothetical protein